MQALCNSSMYFHGNPSDVRGLHAILSPFVGKTLREIRQGLRVDAETTERGYLVGVGDVKELGNGEACFVAEATSKFMGCGEVFRRLARDFALPRVAWYCANSCDGIFEANKEGAEVFGAEYYVYNLAEEYDGALANRVAAWDDGVYTSKLLNTILSDALLQRGDTDELIRRFDEAGGNEFFSAYKFIVVE